jgi:hypothetical protein
MNSSRHSFITNTVPNASLQLRASHRFDGESAPLPPPTLADVADPRTGIVGLGQCQHPTTRRKCPYFDGCMLAMLAGENATCQGSEDVNAERQARNDADEKREQQAQAILAYMRKVGEPVTFRQVCAALGYSETPLLLLGAFKALEASERIETVGVVHIRAKAKKIYRVCTWQPTGKQPAKVAAKKIGAPEKHVGNVMRALRDAGRPLTSCEVKALVGINDSRISNVLMRLQARGVLDRRLRQESPKRKLWEYWITEETA